MIISPVGKGIREMCYSMLCVIRVSRIQRFASPTTNCLSFSYTENHYCPEFLSLRSRFENYQIGTILLSLCCILAGLLHMSCAGNRPSKILREDIAPLTDIEKQLIRRELSTADLDVTLDLETEAPRHNFYAPMAIATLYKRSPLQTLQVLKDIVRTDTWENAHVAICITTALYVSPEDAAPLCFVRMDGLAGDAGIVVAGMIATWADRSTNTWNDLDGIAFKLSPNGILGWSASYTEGQLYFSMLAQNGNGCVYAMAETPAAADAGMMFCYDGSSVVADIELQRTLDTPISIGGADSFGRIHGVQDIRYSIVNRGTLPLELDANTPVRISDAHNCAVVVSEVPSSFVLATDETASFAIRVTPMSLGSIYFDITVLSNSKSGESFTIHCSGTVVGQAPTAISSSGTLVGCSLEVVTPSSIWLVPALLLLVLGHFRRTTRNNCRCRVTTGITR